MQSRLLVALGALALLPLSSAAAQSCIGLPSLAVRPTNLLVDAQFGDGYNAYGARFGFGSAIAFGGVSGQLQDHDNTDGTGKAVGIDAGLSLLVGDRQTVALCPVGSLSYQSNPNDSNQTAGTAGVAIGGTLGTDAGISLIPFASISAVYSRLNGDSPGVRDQTDTFGLLGGGLGLAFNNNIVVRPTVSVPFGIDNRDPVYGIGVAFTFGRR